MPTELEKLERAKQYIKQLANGIDPISGRELPDDSALNQVRLSRCFFYVADVLGQTVVKEKKAAKIPMQPFVLPEDLRGRIPVEPNRMITHFMGDINALIDETIMSKLKVTAFTGWLTAQGYLREDMFNGKRRKVPTEKGRAAGITDEPRQGQFGSYTATIYDENVQRLMIAHLDEIIALSNGAQEGET